MEEECRFCLGEGFCARCGGRGEVLGAACPDCDGDGLCPDCLGRGVAEPETAGP